MISTIVIQPAEDWLDQLNVCNEDAQEGHDDRHVILKVMDRLSPNSERRSKI